jgi:heat shock protein HslJ
MKTKIAVMILLVASLSTACSLNLTSTKDRLDSTRWVLVSMDGDADLIGNPPSAEFEDGKISGSTGCNSYQGSYQVQEDGLVMGPLVRTEMDCQDPKGVMEQEDRFLEILSSAESLTLNDGSLLISGGGFQLDFRILE